MKEVALLILILSSLIFWSSCKHDPLTPYQANPGVNPSDTIPLPPPIISNCDEDSVYFENDIAPILLSSCGSADINCHSRPQANNGVDFSSYASILAGDEDGDPLINTSNPSNSEIIDIINDNDPEDAMPPDTSSYTISNENQLLLISWMQQGAQNNSCEAGCDMSNVTFSTNILPILNQNCISCHSGTSPSGNLNLDSYASISNAALNGNLLDAINWIGSAVPMPNNAVSQIPQCYIDQIQLWVDEGAPNN
jgi:hypothetical protein